MQSDAGCSATQSRGSCLLYVLQSAWQRIASDSDQRMLSQMLQALRLQGVHKLVRVYCTNSDLEFDLQAAEADAGWKREHEQHHTQEARE